MDFVDAVYDELIQASAADFHSEIWLGLSPCRKQRRASLVFLLVFFRALAFKAGHFVAPTTWEFGRYCLAACCTYSFFSLAWRSSSAIDVGDVGGERFASAEHAYDGFFWCQGEEEVSSLTFLFVR